MKEDFGKQVEVIEDLEGIQRVAAACVVGVEA